MNISCVPVADLTWLPIEGGSNRPLPLDGGDRLWLVRDGYADVFAVTGGGRTHLFRVASGDALFGCEPSGLTSLIAVGSLGAHFLAAPVEAAAGDPAWVGRWIERTAEVAAGAERAWPDLLLDGGTHAIAAGLRASPPANALCWVEVLEGAPRWCGGTALAPGAVIPLAAPAWIEDAAGCRVAITDRPPPPGALAPSLRLLNLAVLDLLASRRAALRQEDARRRWEQAERDDAGMATTLLRLASATRRGRDEPAPGDPLGYALDLLCGAIGHAGPVPRPAAGGGDRKAATADLLARSGLHARPVTLAPGWWRRDGAPLLARLDGRDPVALLPAAGRWRLRARGIDRRVDARLAARLDEAQQLYPALPDRPIRAADLARVAGRGIAGDLRRAAAMSLAGALLGLAGPVATALLFEDVVPLGDRRGVVAIVIGLLALTAGRTSFSLVNAIALLRLEARLDGNLQAAVIARLLRLPAAFFRQFSAGDLTERALGLQEARQIVTGSALGAILGSIFAASSFIVMLAISWRVALVALLPVAVAVGATAGLACGQLREERKRTRLRGRLDGFVLQLMTGIGKLRAGAAEKRAMAEWARRDVPLRRAFVAGRRYAAAQATAQALLPALGLVAVYAAAVGLVIPGAAGAGGSTLSAGAFAAFSAAFGQLSGALTGAAMALTHLLAAVPLLERTRPLLEAQPEAMSTGETVSGFRGGIELRRVGFRYSPDAPLVLDDLDLAIKPGEFVAIVGGSGSGKSTIMRLILGFERPESGEVFYDGHGGDRVDLSSLRRSFGVVLQNGRITAGSIHENILIGTGLTLDDAWAAARLVNLDGDIAAMPMGMHTVLNDGGQALSGGQRQRILLARALVQRPKVLLLDEATSALDNRTQAVVTRTLAALNVTRIVIAHRLSTIRDVDRIIVVERGRVVETGAYAELMAAGGPFAALARRQLL